MMRTLILSAVLLLALAPRPTAANEIVKSGQANAVIIVAQEDNETGDTAKAASEIQVFVKKMSGAELPLVKEGEPIPDGKAIRIYVGHTVAAKKAGVQIPSGFNPKIRPDIFEEEGYVLKTKGDNIFIGGNGDGPYHGNLYAAYAFLEMLGCRWYFPAEWGEVIPEKKTLAVAELDIHSKPDFALRCIWLDGRWGWVTGPDKEDQIDWCMRIGFSTHHLGMEGMYVAPGDGSLARFLPPRKYAEAHPEWYAMDEAGHRHVTPKSNNAHTMLCLSNDEMVAEYIKNVKEYFDAKPDSRGIGISPPDGVPYCYCEQCKAASRNFNYPRYAHRTMQTEEVCEFVNKIAAVFPDKLIAVAGYALRDIAPQGVELLPNVAVMQAPISCCVLHPNNDPSCWRRLEATKNLRRWRSLSDHVWLYDYTPGLLVSQFQPERDAANFAINAKIYKEIGLKGFSREGQPSMMASWISYYTAAKFMWDVDSDLDAIKEDFYNTFLGSAAGPHVRAWWDACEEQLLKSTVHVHEAWLVNHLYTAEFSRSIRKHVEAARAAEMTPEQRQRFGVFELIVENFENSTRMDEAVKNLDYKEAAACAERMLAARNEINKTSLFLIRKPAQTSGYRMFTAGRKKHYEKLLTQTDGTTGDMVAPLPLVTKFKRDRFNVGITSEWYQPEFDDTDWGTKNTFFTWDQQDEPEDEVGHDYDGHGWYRAVVDVPANFKGREFRLTGEGINEVWVWVNGQYIGHRKHVIWWMGQSDFELDVTKAIRPGQKNTIAIRVWNDAEIGGLLNRGFLWSPKSR